MRRPRWCPLITGLGVGAEGVFASHGAAVPGRGESGSEADSWNSLFWSLKTSSLGGRDWFRSTQTSTLRKTAVFRRRGAAPCSSLLESGAPRCASGKGALRSPGPEEGCQVPGAASSPLRPFGGSCFQKEPPQHPGRLAGRKPTRPFRRHPEVPPARGSGTSGGTSGGPAR